jgi:hypothetical protein
MKGTKDDKCDKGDKRNKSVAESLNAVVKTHLVTMSEQYNVYATAILEMEEKIKSLKQIMLSQEFLNNIRDVNLSCPASVSVLSTPSSSRDNKKERGHNKENTIISNIKLQGEAQAETSNPSELSFFTPRQKDSLFWCFNIIASGLGQYEYEKNYFTAEQEFKVKTIERIKKGENKQILKQHKMSKNMIESGLMGSRTSGISPKILYALSLFYNVNIFYIYKNTYYEMFSNASADSDTNTTAKIHIIKFNPETNYYSVCSSLDEGEAEGKGKTKILEYIKNSRKTCLELDNLDDVNKPLRPITTYSLTDLVNIAAKMNILDTHILDESSGNTNTKKKLKSKTKSELYSEIMQKCL